MRPISASKALVLCLALAAFPLGLARAQGLGMELGLLSVPIAHADPYSFAASAGLWYEHPLGRGSPLVGGAWAAASGFRSLDADYAQSYMYYGGLELGYAFGLFSTSEAAVSFRPLVRVGWYARSVEYLGAVEWGSRPFASAGCILDLRLASFDLGLSALLSLPMDNAPVVLVGVMQRLGLCL